MAPAYEVKIYQGSPKASREEGGSGRAVGRRNGWKIVQRRLQGWNQLGQERLPPPALQDPQGEPR